MHAVDVTDDEVLHNLDALLRCVICQHILQQPKLLPCHHSCCLSCLEGQSSGGEIHCPECIIGYRLPIGGVGGFQDDVKSAALLYLQQHWRGVQSQQTTTVAENQAMLESNKVANTVSEVIIGLQHLKFRVNDFNRCGDLWRQVIQTKDRAVLDQEKGHPLEKVTGVLRMRRQQLHEKLDAFLKEETQSIHERAEYEICRAVEYSEYVETKLKTRSELSAENLAYMKGQCEVICDKIDSLLSKLCDQVVSMPLKIVKAVDDESSYNRSNTFYGVDIGVQVSAPETMRVSKQKEPGMVPRQSSLLSMSEGRREEPGMVQRQSSLLSQSLAARRRDKLQSQQSAFAQKRQNTEPVIQIFNQQKHTPMLIPRTTVMQPSNRIIKTGYCRNLHRVKAFGRTWFGGRGSRKGPACVMVTGDGILAVTDGTNRCVRLCTMSGLSLDSYLGYPAIMQYFQDPQGVCEDLSRRYLYVTDREQACVFCFDLDTGELLRTIDSEGRPIGATCDQNGTLFVCDEYQHCVSVYHHNGTFIGNIGEKGREDGAFQHPHSVAVAPDNRVWVTDSHNHRLQVFTPTGKFIKCIGKEYVRLLFFTFKFCYQTLFLE